MERLETEMKQRNTEPHLRTQIMEHIRHWHAGTHYEMPPQISYRLQQLRKALKAQSRIGWYNFQLGRVSNAIVKHQQEHYNRTEGESGKTGLRWTVAIINKLKATAWDMWEHRNSVLHGNTMDYHTQRRMRQVDRDIKQQFANGKSELLPRHKHLMQSRRKVLKMNLTDKERWMEAIMGARRAWQDWKDSMPNLEVEREGMRQWRRTGSCSGRPTAATQRRNTDPPDREND